MAQYELLLPKMGESVAEATVIKWLKQPGDQISLDDTLLEIATDKVDSEVPSPVSGKLVSQLYKEDEIVLVGAVVAIIETEDEGSQPAGTNAQAASPDAFRATVTFADSQNMATEPSAMASPDLPPVQESPVMDIPGIEQLPETVPAAAERKSYASSERFYSPLVKNIASQENISAAELDQISGTGAEGRLTKDDLLNYLERERGTARTTAPTPESGNAQQTFQQVPSVDGSQGETSKSNPVATKSMSGRDEMIEMDRMGKLIAEHMVMSKQTSAHVTSFVEADVTNLVMWRERVKKNFEKRENEKITFTPIFIEAVAKAIKDFPMINVSVQGNTIVKKKDINIGMAAALPTGNLIVPVIKNADQLNLLGLTKAVNNLAQRARGTKLKPDETQGGTFTLTNIGSFGNILGTPIINQPQVAILAVGSIKKKPAVLETETGDVIAIRHMMYLSLSYDHRVVNGALGGTFVKKVADYLENWDINREI